VVTLENLMNLLADMGLTEVGGICVTIIVTIIHTYTEYTHIYSYDAYTIHAPLSGETVRIGPPGGDGEADLSADRRGQGQVT
jgi:hypothetical protein